MPIKKRQSLYWAEPLEPRRMLSQTLGVTATPQTFTQLGANGTTVAVDVTFHGPAVDVSTFTSDEIIIEGPKNWGGPTTESSVLAIYAGLAASDPGAEHGYRVAEFDANLPTPYNYLTVGGDNTFTFELYSDRVVDDELGYFPQQSFTAFVVTPPAAVAVTMDGNSLDNGGTIDFGSTYTGLPGQSHTLQITNTSDAPLTLSMDNAAAAYAVEDDVLTLVSVVGRDDTKATTPPMTLIPGASTSVVVQFNENYENEGAFLIGAPAGSYSSSMNIYGPSGLVEFNFGVAATLLPTGPGEFNIQGTVTNNIAGNADTNLSGITVYLDLNHNGKYDPLIDLATTTSADGSYYFKELPSGKYTAHVDVPAGWQLNPPASAAGISITPTIESVDDGSVTINFQEEPAQAAVTGNGTISITPQTIQSFSAGGVIPVDITFTGANVDPSTFGNLNFIATGLGPSAPDGPSVTYAGLAASDPGAGHGYRVAEYDVTLLSIYQTYDVNSGLNSHYYLALQAGQVGDGDAGYFPPALVHAFDVDLPYAASLAVDGKNLAPGGTVQFGSVTASSAGLQKTITVTNILQQPITVALADDSGTQIESSGDFYLATIIDLVGYNSNDTSQTSSVTLAPGKSTTFQIEFDIATAEAVAGSSSVTGNMGLLVTVNGVSDPYTISFNCTGSAAGPPALLQSAVNINGYVNDPDETGLQGITVYLDQNDNGVYNPGVDPATTTNSNGYFSFPSLAPDNYTVREVVPAGWEQTTPSSNGAISVTKTMEAEGNGTVNIDFGQQSSATAPPAASVSVAGDVYFDTTGDAGIASGDKPAAGLTVYIDENNDGTLDSGDPTATVSADGGYSFQVSPPALVRVRVIVPSGDSLVIPAAGDASQIDVTTSSDYGGNDFLISTQSLSTAQQRAADRAAIASAIAARRSQLALQRQAIASDNTAYRSDLGQVRAAHRQHDSANYASLSQAVQGALAILSADRKTLSTMLHTDFTEIGNARNALAKDLRKSNLTGS